MSLPSLSSIRTLRNRCAMNPLAGCGKTPWDAKTPVGHIERHSRKTSLQDAQKGRPARPQQAKRRGILRSVRGASEVHDALNKARHVCERRRDGEATVSCENDAGGLFQHPVRIETPSK